MAQASATTTKPISPLAMRDRALATLVGAAPATALLKPVPPAVTNSKAPIKIMITAPMDVITAIKFAALLMTPSGPAIGSFVSCEAACLQRGLSLVCAFVLQACSSGFEGAASATGPVRNSKLPADRKVRRIIFNLLIIVFLTQS